MPRALRPDSARRPARPAPRRLWLVPATLPTTAFAALALTSPIFVMSFEDFHLPGTQVAEVGSDAISTSDACVPCHGGFDAQNAPHSAWSGSLMAHAGRDPLFLAQMTTANQDVENAGYFCMRCHVPLSFVTGHAYDTDGSTLDATDLDGVTCHFCHSMVDPIHKPGISPEADAEILAGLESTPGFYGNAMFVLDPSGTRRGPYGDAQAPHAFIRSPFHHSGEMCGTCHDVGNVAVTKQADGTYRYNNLDTRPLTDDLHAQFPLERTYSEWKLSAFANGGVDLRGRFGGEGAAVVETCQDCHMPRVRARGAATGPTRRLARHDFAGAAAPVLDLIAEAYKKDPAVDLEAIASGREKAVSMLERAISLRIGQRADALDVRVVNETGHKLPTGHIEGRRVWLNVRFLDAAGNLIGEHGHYDEAEAELDETSTAVYEMHVGLSEDAALATGLPAGRTTHMALADTIELDNRIPPRGFTNGAFAAAGAPAVGRDYRDGQYWDDRQFPIPEGAVAAVATAYYQSTPREYIEALRDANRTDHWGDTLHELRTATGRGAPIAMASRSLVLCPRERRTTAADQTKRTQIVSAGKGSGDQLLTKGAFSLRAGEAFAPDENEVAVEIRDGSGVHFETVLPAGAFARSADGRKFVYKGGAAGVRLAKLIVDGEGRVKYVVKAKGLDHADFADGIGGATIRVGERCFADDSDLCAALPGRAHCR